MKNTSHWIFVMLWLSVITGCCGGPNGSSSAECDNSSLIEQIGFSFSLDSTNNGFKLTEIDTTWVLVYSKTGNNYFGLLKDSITYLPNQNPTAWFAFTSVDYNQTQKYTSNLSYKIKTKNSPQVYEVKAIEFTPVKSINKCCEGSGQKLNSYLLNGVSTTNNVVVLQKN